MKNLSLKVKLAASFLIAGTLPLICLSLYSYSESSSTLEREAVSKLVTVRDIKGQAVKRYFNVIRDQVLTFSHNVMIEDAMKGFSLTFKNFNKEVGITPEILSSQKKSLSNFYVNEFGQNYKKINKKEIDSIDLLHNLSPTAISLQHHYISGNENPLGSKEVLNFSKDKSEYSKLHAKYHPSVREFLLKFGYYDIFLVDINSGDIVYSVFKELDYATSLLTGPYKDTNFADAFRKAKKLTDKDSYVLVDYKSYAPSYEAPASFIATPVWSGKKKIGVAIFQMPIDRLNEIMSERSGMGETGEFYLFGSDHLLRSDSFLSGKKHSVNTSFRNVAKSKINSSSITKVLSGSEGSSITKNYLGQDVLSAYTPFSVLNLKWGLIAEIGKGEAFESLYHYVKVLIVVFLVSITALFLFSFFFSNKLAKSISKIARILNSCASRVANSSEEMSKSSTLLSSATTQQASAIQETAASIDEIGAIIQKNADVAKDTNNVSEDSTLAAKYGRDTVEDMIKSINQISESNDRISSEVQKNNDDISNIVSVISQIGEKTKVINDIVFQTKLLSFNASVEAARAGDHGKGFSVVAEEVGKLAEMSGSAAHEITAMLDESIRQVTTIVEKSKVEFKTIVSSSQNKIEVGSKTATDCGKALDKILSNVTLAGELVSNIAIASKEQAIGVGEVNSAVSELDDTTHQSAMIAQGSAEVATILMVEADSLKDAVGELMNLVEGRVA